MVPTNDPDRSATDADAPPSKRWPPFRRMVEVQAAHAAGDALVAVALANTLFFDVPIDEARSKVLLYLLLTMTPFALLSPVVGPLLDRRLGAYRLAMVASGTGRAVLAFTMATRTDRLWLYPLAFGVLVLSRTHGVSRSSFVPDVLPPNRTLISANAALSLVSVLAGAAAALPGFGIEKWLGPGVTLRIAGVVFGVAALGALGLPKPARSPAADRPRPAAAGGVRRSPLLSPRLLAAGIETAASRAAIGFGLFLLAFLLKEQGEAARGFAIVVAGAGAGGLLGAVGAPLARRILREMLLLLVALIGMAVVAFFAAEGFGLPWALGVAAATGLGASAARLAFDSLIQRDAPLEVRGRTFARYETLFQIFWVAGAGFATAIPWSAGVGLRALGLISIAGLAFGIWIGAGRPGRPTSSETDSDPFESGDTR